jgi:AmiR/NasT family two-component response regulator
MSGIEMARVLREHHGIAALFLSAFSDRDLVRQAVAEGALGYVTKPADSPQLIPAIETAIARSRDLTALRETQRNLERALAAGRKTSMAVGILMERRGLSEQAAFEALRGGARKHQSKLEDYSHDLVAAAQRLNRD